MADTYWTGQVQAKLYKNSGFTATILDSFLVTSITNFPQGCSWNDSDISWVGLFGRKLYLQSGFSSTLKDSANISAAEFSPTDITSDNNDYYFSGNDADKIYKVSGFSTTIIDSYSVSITDNQPSGVTFDGNDIKFSGLQNKKIYHNSGFTSTVKDSILITSIDPTNYGCSWTGNDLEWMGFTNDFVFKQSGFTTTVIDSFAISIETVPRGVTHGSMKERLSDWININNVKIQKNTPGFRVRHKGRNIYTIHPRITAPELPTIGEAATYPAGTRGDGIKLEVSDVEIFNFNKVRAVQGTYIDKADGNNGPGQGVLRVKPYVNGSYLISWKAPGSELFGSSVIASEDGLIVCEDGFDASKWVRVQVYIDWLPATQTDAIVHLQDVYNNEIGQDNVTAAEASSGDVLEYQITMEVTSPIDILEVRGWLDYGTALNNGIEISSSDYRENGNDNTLLVGFANKKLFQFSSFSNTLIDSVPVGTIDTSPFGISSDNNRDVIWGGYSGDKNYKQSQFTTTLIDSYSTAAFDTQPFGIAWSETGTLICGENSNKLFLQSGFSSTVADSVSVGSIDTILRGITIDENDTSWTGEQADRIYKMSGFTSTLIDSFSINPPDTNPRGCSTDNTDIFMTGAFNQKMYKFSGFSSTIKNSVSISVYDTTPHGSAFYNYADRTDSNWKSPHNEYHIDALTWDRLATGAEETIYVRRTVDPNTVSKDSLINALNFSWYGL